MVGDDGRARVLDFGLAHSKHSRAQLLPADGFADTAQGDEGPPSSSALDHELTAAGSVLGTPAYMAPEQHLGGSTDARTDQFAFCVALHEALYGVRPFRGRTLAELLKATTRGAITPPPREVALPKWLRRLVLRGLKAHPEDRWPSMQALLSELSRDRGRLRRRWLGVAAALGGATLGVAGFASGMQEPPSACRGVSALDGIWGAAAERALEQSVRASGLVYADETWARLEPALDEYARAWGDARRSACEQHQRGLSSSQLYDRSVICLDRRRAELAAVVQVLTGAEGDARRAAVEHALQAVAGLTPVSVCADAERLMSSRATPEDPALRARVDALRERLATVAAQRRAAQYAAAMPEADALVREAEDAGYKPALAEALLERGLLRGHADEATGADEDLSAALWTAEATRHDHVAITASQQRLLIYTEQLADYPRARQWIDHATALVERDDDARARAQLEFLVGVLSLHEGDFQGAREELSRALELSRAAFGEDDLMVARVRRTLASALNSLGAFDEGRAHLEASLRAAERALGPRHPRLAQILLTLGNMHIGQGREEQAMAAYERALTITREALGPEHASTGAMMLSVGLVHSQRREYARARALLEQSLALFERAYGPEHPNVGVALANLASAESGAVPPGPLDESGRAALERALSHLRRAATILEAALGPEHKDLASIRTNIANLLRRRGEHGAAEPLYRGAIETLERTLGPTHHGLANPVAGLARSLLDRGRAREAAALARRALELRAANGEPDVDLAGERWLLGLALWDASPRGERARAYALIEQARDSYAEAGARYRHDLDETSAWLREHAP